MITVAPLQIKPEQQEPKKLIDVEEKKASESDAVASYSPSVKEPVPNKKPMNQ